MKLSIITICYNDKAGFEKTAKSVIAQTYRDFEWIIVDGGSTDGSAELIEDTVNTLTARSASGRFDKACDSKSPLTAYPKVYWKSEKDKGIYNAMNKGIRQAHGEYLLFMNAGDCLYAEDTLERALPLLKGADVYVGDIVNEMDGVQQLYQFPRNLTPETILDQMVFNLIPHQSSFMKRDLFDRFGMYREDLRIASDGYFFYKSVVLGGATMECIPLTIALFDCTGVSSNSRRAMEERASAHDITPCEKVLYTFYRDNHDIVKAFNANALGRLLMRAYFFLYRKCLKHL